MHITRDQVTKMVWYWVGGASRRLRKSSLSSSTLYLSRSIFNPLSSTTSHPTPNPNYLKPFRPQYNRFTPIPTLEFFKFDWGFRFVAHISRSARRIGVTMEGQDCHLPSQRCLGSTCICRNMLAHMLTLLASISPLGPGSLLGLVCGTATTFFCVHVLSNT